ncbi:hypothetical protein ASG80_10720 [Agromyces sp. Soil535]|nr:hypothetical protein ASG80_10720 [Agromyces sp. Soil535]
MIGSGTIIVGAALMYTGRTFWGWPANFGYIAWERGFVIAAVLVSVLGLALLEQLLRDAGAVILPRLAFVTYLVGAIVLISAEAFVIAGRGYLEPQIVLFVVLACLAQAAYGVALVQSRLVAAWVGWLTIAWNVGALGILALLFPNVYYPVLHFIAPVIIGIALLLPRRHRAESGPAPSG